MATTTQSTLGVNHIKVSVAITKEDYLPNYDKSLKTYAKSANIPGFRKGMVPAGMVKKMYGKNLKADEVLRAANQGLEEFIKENKIEFLGQPLGMETGNSYDFDVDNHIDYTFDFEVGIKPSFDIPLFATRQKMNAYKVKVSDEMINEEVEKVQYNKGTMTEPEVIADDDDVLNVSIEACDADGTVPEGAAKKTNSLLYKYFTAAMQAKLKGKAAGEIFVTNLKDAFTENILPAVEKDCGLQPGADNSASFFKFTIDKLGHVEKAAIDTALFELVMPGVEIKTEEEFRTKLGDEIAVYWEGQGRNRLHNDLYERLVHETPIDLPINFLKRWMAEGGEQKMSMEDVEAKYSSFEHGMIWQLVSDKIIREEKLLPTNDEVRESTRMDVMAYLANMSFPVDDTQSELVNGIVDKQMADNKYTSEQYDKIATSKLFMALEQKIEINMNELPIDEFLAVKSEYAHHHAH
jgi:trigger factor